VVKEQQGEELPVVGVFCLGGNDCSREGGGRRREKKRFRKRREEEGKEEKEKKREKNKRELKCASRVGGAWNSIAIAVGFGALL